MSEPVIRVQTSARSFRQAGVAVRRSLCRWYAFDECAAWCSDLSRSEDTVPSDEHLDRGGKVPTVVPSRAFVDEVKALKQGDIYVGRGSKQRGLLPSFWANRYKVSRFGRDRAVELYRSEIREAHLYGRRINELSGERLLCHYRTSEKCHSDNLQDLLRELHPHLRSCQV